jgi:hypothetical protein
LGVDLAGAGRQQGPHVIQTSELRFWGLSVVAGSSIAKSEGFLPSECPSLGTCFLALGHT